MKRKKMIKKDTFQARLAFYLSLGFWIPLFNVGLTAVSILVGIKAINRIQKDSRFGGLTYAIIALVLSFIGLIFTLLYVYAFLRERMTCETLPTLF